MLLLWLRRHDCYLGNKIRLTGNHMFQLILAGIEVDPVSNVMTLLLSLMLMSATSASVSVLL